RSNASALGANVWISTYSLVVWKPAPRGPRPSIAGTPSGATVLASLPPPSNAASPSPRPASRAHAAYSSRKAAEAAVRSSGNRFAPPVTSSRTPGIAIASAAARADAFAPRDDRVPCPARLEHQRARSAARELAQVRRRRRRADFFIADAHDDDRQVRERADVVERGERGADDRQPALHVEHAGSDH